MLKSLSIWNFALIKFVQIDFTDKLNILTGETGAGKSIMMDALGIALGNRGNMDNLRYGCDFLRVEAVFDLTAGHQALRDFLNTNNIVLEDETLIIVRQINAQGRNSIQVNNCNITLSKLKQIGTYLVDIHSQHSNQLLLKENYQLDILDNYDKGSIAPLLADYKTSYDQWRQLIQELNDYKLNKQELAQRLDLLNWQIKEIKGANLVIGEDEQLEGEIKKLANSEKIANYIKDSIELFEDRDSYHYGLTAGLDKLRKNLAALTNYSKEYEEYENIVTEAYYQIKEVESFVGDQQYALEFSPDKLDDMQYRLNEIDKLKLKYGTDIKSILAYLNKIEIERNKIANFDDNLEELNKQLASIEQELAIKGEKLRQQRCQQGEVLAAEIVAELKTLGMVSPSIEFKVEAKKDYGPRGGDNVYIMFSANVGDLLKPLNKVASGGELSRVSLAIKTVMAGKDDVDLLVFDEVDTGVGGKTALKIAEKIAKIAARRQVICITHLPQIAAMADTHFYISKTIEDGKTYTEIQLLPIKSRLEEIARMMSGTENATIAIENAKLVVDNAEKFKSSL